MLAKLGAIAFCALLRRRASGVFSLWTSCRMSESTRATIRLIQISVCSSSHDRTRLDEDDLNLVININ